MEKMRGCASRDAEAHGGCWLPNWRACRDRSPNGSTSRGPTDGGYQGKDSQKPRWKAVMAIAICSRIGDCIQTYTFR